MVAKHQLVIKIRGTVYPTVKHAAAALGVSASTIYAALHRNALDNVGVGKGNYDRGGKSSAAARPVDIGPLHYASARKASLDLGLNESSVWQTLNRRKGRSKENLLAKAMDRILK